MIIGSIIFNGNCFSLIKVTDEQLHFEQISSGNSFKYVAEQSIIIDYLSQLVIIVLFNYSAINFIFGNGFVYEEKTAWRYTDVFINCSVNSSDASTEWEFKNVRIYPNDKYSLNNSGLTIHNVTAEDQGHYICFLGNVYPLNATILLKVVCKLLSTNFMCIIIMHLQSFFRATRIALTTKQDSRS